MTDATAMTEADLALKTKHRKMWALGDYPTLASELIPGLGRALVQACGTKAGDRVLDIAAGTGNAAIPAARTGADVVACDLTPELLDAGRRRAREQGIELEWREADAEALPFDDGEFDTVMSCVGVMFAPHHGAAADELVRVCRPGGTIGLLSWTPEGFIGQMFAAVRPYSPAPPPGAQPPPLWGNEEHVRTLLGDRVTDLQARRATVTVDRFGTPEAFRDYFKTVYGPAIAVYNNIGDSSERVAELDSTLVELARQHGCGTGDSTMEWEYLLVTGRRSG
ncbi:class I SAM-dependent methyltransferase [Streptomyces sp. NPDC003023]|uniref:class I SAM-dependent methyltransferase n=1 Tax=Streptomyces sp. NPDC003023 TaxID=3364675 RepID=UPI0036768D28